VVKLGLVDQTELARWADSREAQGELPRLIRRLILETGRGVVQLGFPGGEGIATGGWDGTARATETTAFIPDGLSLWELSVDKNPGKKADKDFAKRLATPDGSPTEGCTYVEVSLRRWGKRLEWANTRSAEGRWKAVRAYGIDDLETWLESAPITHAWLSELLGFHPHGLLSAETWWTSWSGATTPPLPAAVVLAGRSDQVTELRAKLAGPGQLTTVQGASPDDVIAFISALALTDAEAQGGLLLSRMALIDKVEAWRRLREHPVPLILVPRTQEVIDDLGAGSAHHLIVPIVGGEAADIKLEPIDSQDAGNALEAAGLSQRLARETGKIVRLSLLAARRRIAQKPELHRPQWATSPVSRLQRRALLVGRWDERSAGDISIVGKIFGDEYDLLREELSPLMSTQDPLFTHFGSSIGLVSHFDAWLLLRRELRKDDLELFQSAVNTVFSEINPAFELPPEDRWMASLRGKVRTHSADLRLGLATTLALLGSYGDMVVAGSGLSGQDWASSTVRRILETANQDKTCHLWASLRDVLSLFAEASPTIFLDAVRDGLHGESPLLQRIFMDNAESSVLFTDSPHSSLLWALEICAWSSMDFGQAVDLLARLVEIDPGGRLGNRPAACLAAIFWPLYPQSSVSIERRLAALDGLRKRHGSVAWSLMVSMLPNHGGGIANPMSEPRFRDWKPQKISATTEEYWNQIGEVVHRLLEDVETDPARWVPLVKELPNLPSQLRASVLDSLKALSANKSLDDQARDQIWESLRVQAARHREFRKAKWALPPDEVNQMEEVGRLFRPLAPSTQLKWLFDEYRPNLPGSERNDNDYELKLMQYRAEAAAKIAKSMTWPEMHRFAISAKLPWSFGAALVQAGLVAYDREVLSLLSGNESADLQFASGYLSKRFRTEGWIWVERHLREGGLSPEQSGWLLLATDDFPRAWEVAEAASEEIATAFWRHFRTYGLGNDFSYVEVAAQRLLGVGRPGGALELLILYTRQGRENERVDLMACCLEELCRRPSENSDIGVLGHHDLVEIFSYLERSSLSTERLAKLEWAYLPVFDHGSSPPTLSRYLAQNPSFFVEVVSQVYRPHTLQEDESEEPNSEPEMKMDEARERIARNAYHLLSGWRTLPGVREDGTVEGEFLMQWVHESRQLLRAVRRSEVGDLHIGQMLASSPPAPDGIWPCVEVRDLLESLQSAKVEDGLRLRLHNDRGVTMRGMLDGGDQELELATKYRKQADQFADQWPRTAVILRGLAEDYEHEARHYDQDAERRRKGFET
jgi:hypothetical protein